MKSRLTAFVTIVALALSGISATPVEARSKKSNDTIKLLLGAAAVALLLSQTNQAQATRITPRPDPSYDDDWDGTGFVRPSRTRRIPAECVIGVALNGRYRDVVSARCVSNFGLSGRLPEECAFDIRTRSGRRTVYGPQCLRDYGYRIGQARY